MATNIQKYLAFLKTVEYGSFTRAGELLGYTQSNISHMVNDLETEWRVSLLERKHSGVSLTSDGVALMPYIRAVYDDYLKLQTQVDALNGHPAHWNAIQRGRQLAARGAQRFSSGSPGHRYSTAVGGARGH